MQEGSGSEKGSLARAEFENPNLETVAAAGFSSTYGMMEDKFN